MTGHTVYEIENLIRANLNLLLSNFLDIMLQREFLRTKKSWKENGLALYYGKLNKNKNGEIAES